MRVYKICFSTEDGVAVRWAGSLYEASATVAQELRNAPEGEHFGHMGTYRVEIPTDKAGLLRWLNDNFDMDNG